MILPRKIHLDPPIIVIGGFHLIFNVLNATTAHSTQRM
jgi:hypothetical protein